MFLIPFVFFPFALASILYLTLNRLYRSILLYVLIALLIPPVHMIVLGIISEPFRQQQREEYAKRDEEFRQRAAAINAEQARIENEKKCPMSSLSELNYETLKKINNCPELQKELCVEVCGESYSANAIYYGTGYNYNLVCKNDSADIKSCAWVGQGNDGNWCITSDKYYKNIISLEKKVQCWGKMSGPSPYSRVIKPNQ